MRDMFNAFFPLIIFPAFVVATEITCQSQKDCYTPGGIRCSVCVDGNTKGLGHCIFPYTNLFIEDTKCKVVSNCKDNCSSHGICTDRKMFITSCNCDEGYYGYSCEHRSSPGFNFLTYISISFADTIAQPGIFMDWAPFTRGYNKIPNNSVSITTQDGFYWKADQYVQKRDPNGSDYWVWYIPVSRFPYKPYTNEKNERFLKLGNEVLGYVTEANIKFITYDMINFDHNYTMLVLYEDSVLTCIAVCKLTNCGTSIEDATTFSRSSYIEINSNTKYMADGRYVTTTVEKADCAGSSKTSWKIWKMYRDALTSSETDDFAIYQNYTSRGLILNPYFLEIGTFKVLIEERNVQSSGVSLGYAYCFFRIKSNPLVAIVDGGLEKVEYKQFGLKLSAKRSYDPNMPPSKQGHVNVEWSCVNALKPNVKEEMCAPKNFKVSEVYYFPSEELTAGVLYNFTLKVWTDKYDKCDECDHVSPRLTQFTVEVINAPANATENIFIQCVQNCGEKVINNQVLFLKATSAKGVPTKDVFEWTYKTKGTELSTDKIKVLGLPSYMLLLREDVLESGSQYTIVVRVSATGWFNKYSFETDKMVYEGNCTVQPDTGIKGQSSFDIVCTFVNDSSFIYEFYDKTVEEAKEGSIFSGRMLGSSHTGQLHDFTLTRGQVCVYIMNNNGLFVQKQVDIKLSDAKPDIVDELMKNLTDTMKLGDVSRALRALSVIPDLVPQTMDKSKVFDTLLSYFIKIPLNTLADVKLSLSTLTNVLLALNKPIQLGLTPYLMMSTLGIVLQQADTLLQSVKNREMSRFMSQKEIRLVTKSILNCLAASLLCKDKKMEGIDFDDFDFSVLKELKQGSISAEATIDSVKDILSYIQFPGQPPTRISTNGNYFVVWAMEDDHEYNMTNLLIKDKDIPVSFSNTLLRMIDKRKRQEEQLSLQVVAIDDNIFWWCKSDIKSKLVSVSLARQMKSVPLIPISRLESPIDMVVNMDHNLTNVIITNVVIQPDSKLDPDLLDMDVRIHRLDLAPRSLMSITFLYPATNSSLRVLVLDRFRPDYSMMVNKSVLITQQSPTYPVVYNTYDDPTFWFMGILPGPEVSTNESACYAFEVNTTVCQLWATGQWSSLGCQIGPNTEGKKVHCQCSHFSIFAAAFPVPPQEVDPFADAKLFLTVLDNPLVVSFIIGILLVYVLVCVWLWRQDKRDKTLREVILLDDNFPDDSYAYLVAVYTSSKFNAGTTAHVGIKIIGTSASSRAHILSSKDRKVLKNNTDDWFVIFTPGSLGELKTLHLWHDNSGSSPEWFCEKIYVYNLSEKSETLFLVEQWLALRLNYYPEANVLSAAVHDVIDFKRVFLDNVILGMRDGHILLSILFRHPRSNVSRLERGSVFMCCFMVATLCSIMFYVPSDQATNTDDYQYDVGTREVYISIESLIISVMITFVVLFAFRRSYKYKYQRIKNTLHLRRAEDNPLRDFSRTQLTSQRDVRLVDSYGTSVSDMPKPRSENSLYQNFVRFVTKSLKSQSLNPAQLPHLAPVVTIRKKWFILAWVLCEAVILVCAYLVMLYGLKLGLVQSYKWLSVVLLSVGEEVFITGPLRIIIYSSLLSLAFQRMFEVGTHRVGAEDVMVLHQPNDDRYLEKLLARRNHPMYAPLSTQVREEMLRKMKVRDQWWQLIDFAISLCFLVVLSTLISHMWSSHFHNNRHMKVVLEDPSYDGALSFRSMQNISNIENYLEFTFVEALYNVKWYNDWHITNDHTDDTKYWAADFTNKMIGLPVIRQLRVKPVTCNTMVFKKGMCAPPFSYSENDDDVYGVGWTPAKYYDVNRNNSPWKYTYKTTSVNPLFYRLYGESGRLYRKGGYLQTLGPLHQQTELALAELKENRWEDHLTRMLAVELTLYNVNNDMFTQVTLMAEYMAAGTLLLKAQTQGVEGLRQLSVWGLVFIAFIIYYIVRSAYLINNQGLLEYVRVFNNVCRIIVVAMGCLTIVLYSIHYYSSADYSEQFQRIRQESDFDYDSFTIFFVYLQLLLSVLLCFAILRSILMIRGGRSLINYWYTFTISISSLIWICFLASLFVMVLYRNLHLFNIFIGHWSQEFMIKYRSMSHVETTYFNMENIRAFMFVKYLFSFIFSSFLILLFMHNATVARAYKPKATDDFNFVKFIVTQLKRRHR